MELLDSDPLLSQVARPRNQIKQRLAAMQAVLVSDQGNAGVTSGDGSLVSWVNQNTKDVAASTSGVRLTGLSSERRRKFGEW